MLNQVSAEASAPRLTLHLRSDVGSDCLLDCPREVSKKADAVGESGRRLHMICANFLLPFCNLKCTFRNQMVP